MRITADQISSYKTPQGDFMVESGEEIEIYGTIDVGNKDIILVGPSISFGPATTLVGRLVIMSGDPIDRTDVSIRALAVKEFLQPPAPLRGIDLCRVKAEMLRQAYDSESLSFIELVQSKGDRSALLLKRDKLEELGEESVHADREVQDCFSEQFQQMQVDSDAMISQLDKSLKHSSPEALAKLRQYLDDTKEKFDKESSQHEALIEEAERLVAGAKEFLAKSREYRSQFQSEPLLQEGV